MISMSEDELEKNLRRLKKLSDFILSETLGSYISLILSYFVLFLHAKVNLWFATVNPKSMYSSVILHPWNV